MHTFFHLRFRFLQPKYDQSRDNWALDNVKVCMYGVLLSPYIHTCISYFGDKFQYIIHTYIHKVKIITSYSHSYKHTYIRTYIHT